MISHKYRCIFIHIPKCAGTSVEATFESLGEVEQLLRCRHLFEAVEKYPDYFRFTIVRDPLSRAASAWEHSMKVRSSNDPEAGYFDKLKRGFRRHVYGVRCFEEYLDLVSKYLRTDGLYERLKTSEDIHDFGRSLTWRRLSRFDVYHVLPQVFFTRELQPQVVCKIETLEENWKVIQAKVGIQGVGLGWIRSPDAGPVDQNRQIKKVFSNNEIELVRDIYADDYIAFDYDNPLDNESD